jgi:microsomal dipeptidase-like Zn-dependent dipeptidase
MSFAGCSTKRGCFRRAKHIHSTVLTLDSHCDTPMFFSQGVDFTRRDARLCTDLHKMQEGRQDATIMVAYLAQGTRDEAHFERMKRKVEQTFATIRETVARCPEQLAIARTPQELYANKAAGRKSIMLGIENGYAIGRDITLVEHFRRSEGIVYMTLCHNGCNDICDSARGAAEHGGVSAFGADVIREMNRTGLMVDLSHAAETSFYDATTSAACPSCAATPRPARSATIPATSPTSRCGASQPLAACQVRSTTVSCAPTRTRRPCSTRSATSTTWST